MFNVTKNIFDEIEQPEVILSTRYHKHLGRIPNVVSVNTGNNLSSYQEVSFDVYKKADDVICDLWEDITDFKYIYIPERKEYYEIYISVDEDDDTVKHITGKSACEVELSNRILYDLEINTETDILREDYIIPTVFYNSEHPEASLLHRVLADKAPDYTIVHVDSTLANIQRTFSADNVSIYDFLTNTVAQEIGCLFVFDSVNRTISVYDLYVTCNDCGYRGDYIDTCPECGSNNVTKCYGEDTGIFISAENFSELVSIEGDADNVKNCFKIEGGDDLITSTVININPNGSSYIYNLSDDMMKDMPSELVEKLNTYNTLYDSKKEEYATLTENLYEKIDEELYLQSSMMPSVELQDTTASEQLALLLNSISEVAVANLNSLSKTSADLAVKGMAKVIVDARYDVDIVSSSLTDYISGTTRTWSGIFSVANNSDEDDTATSQINKSIIIVGNDYEEYLYQKILKTLDKDDSCLQSIFEITDITEFKTELKKYCLDSLEGFESAYQKCIEVLIENGVTDSNAVFYDVDLYNSMYVPYYNKLVAIQEEMIIREQEILNVQSERESIQKSKREIQSLLDFKNYLGDDLWKIFCLYLREESYSNSNYVSDGLNNTELVQKAEELFKVAQIELKRACELQLSISNTLKNLLALKEFEPLRNKFQLGNWIRVGVDNKVYKVRLIEIGINYDNLDQISVSFSSVIKLQSNVSDAQDIISNMQSISGSYDYVAHQASQGESAESTIDEYRKVGLNSALYKIFNSDTQNVIYDEHGISCRQYDDILDTYSPKQLRIINNCLAFTSDNWETVRAALGEMKYILDGVTYEDYGLNADHVISGIIIGGDIYSGNYSSINNTGTHINLTDGTFSFAGNKFIYDGTTISLEGKITATSGKIGNWNIGTALYSGTDSITSTKVGTYIGTDGFRNYKDTNHYVDIIDGVITANNANISGNITASYLTANTGGNIAGWDISSNTLTGDALEQFKSYTQDDIATMQQIITGNIEVTNALLKTYDINGDGRISANDVVLAQRILSGLDSNEQKGKIIINATSLRETILLIRESNSNVNLTTKIGCGAISSTYMSADSLITDELTTNELKVAHSDMYATNIKLIRLGSTTINSSGTSVELFADSLLSEWAGCSVNGNNSVVFISNGNGVSTNIHFNSATHVNSSWYATFESAVNGTIVINWLVIVWE